MVRVPGLGRGLLGLQRGIFCKNGIKIAIFAILRNWLGVNQKVVRNTPPISGVGYPTVKELGPNSTWYPRYKLGTMGVKGEGGWLGYKNDKSCELPQVC